MKQLAKIVFSLLFAGLLFFYPWDVSAQTCTTLYGGTVTCQPTDLTINKLVAKPRAEEIIDTKGSTQVVTTGTLVFVENLTIDNAYKPGQEVVFKLIVVNNSNITLTGITVRDVFPQYLTFVAGPGTFSSGALIYTIDKLEPGQRNEQQILARVMDAKDLTGPDNFCVLNRGEVSTPERAHNDTAQVCVTKTEPAKKLPVAGVNELAMMIPFIGVGLTGITLLRKRR